MMETLMEHSQTIIVVGVLAYVVIRDIAIPLIRGQNKQLCELGKRIGALELAVNNLSNRFVLLANLIHSDGAVSVPESLREPPQ